jgi:hypothetical protein
MMDSVSCYQSDADACQCPMGGRASVQWETSDHSNTSRDSYRAAHLPFLGLALIRVGAGSSRGNTGRALGRPCAGDLSPAAPQFSPADSDFPESAPSPPSRDCSTRLDFRVLVIYRAQTPTSSFTMSLPARSSSPGYTYRSGLPLLVIFPPHDPHLLPSPGPLFPTLSSSTGIDCIKRLGSRLGLHWRAAFTGPLYRAQHPVGLGRDGVQPTPSPPPRPMPARHCRVPPRLAAPGAPSET